MESALSAFLIITKIRPWMKRLPKMRLPGRYIPGFYIKMPKIKSFTTQPFDHSTTFILRCAHRAWGFVEVPNELVPAVRELLAKKVA